MNDIEKSLELKKAAERQIESIIKELKVKLPPKIHLVNSISITPTIGGGLMIGLNLYIE